MHLGNLMHLRELVYFLLLTFTITEEQEEQSEYDITEHPVKKTVQNFCCILQLVCWQNC